MTIEELRALVKDTNGVPMSNEWEKYWTLTGKLHEIAPEILALVEAIKKHEEMGGCGSMYEAESGDIHFALKSFNAKLEKL